LRRKRSFWWFLAALLAFAGWFATRVAPNVAIETNLLALLPVTDRARDELAAVSLFARRASSELITLVGSTNHDQARVAAQKYAAELQSSQAFDAVQFELDAKLIETYRAESAQRAAVLSGRHRLLLESGSVAELEREALQAAFGPAGLGSPFGVADDPLGLLGDSLIAQAPTTGAARIDRGLLGVEDGERKYYLVRARVAGDAYSIPVQDRVQAALERAAAAATAVEPGAEIVSSGVILHAAAGTRVARSEVAWFGGAGFLGIIVLMLAVFRSLRPLLLTILSIAIAATAGLAACHFAFGSVHILTLTFGTSLIGVSVDYSLHYFANRLRDAEAKHVSITPALLLGCATTVIGYLALLLAPIPGLRQIALFSAVGLVVACSCVILLYPGFESAAAPRAVPPWAERLARVPAIPSRWLPYLATAAIIVAGLGVWQLRTDDDVRSLQRSPAALVAGEQRVRTLLDTGFDSRFVLLLAPSAELLLQRAEQLGIELARLEQAGALAGHLSVAQSLPSAARQASNRALLQRDVYGADGALTRVMTALGFSASDIEQRRAQFAASETRPYTASEWVASPASEPWRNLWLGSLGDEFGTVVLLRNVSDAVSIAAAASSVPGARYIDQVSDITSVLRHYRVVASELLLLVLTLIAACLLARYRSWAALRIALPAVGSVVLTVALLAIFQQPLNLLHVLALLLVLGMGVDYAVFLNEGRSASAAMAVALCSLTTLLSFGLLSISSVPFVKSIGLTVLIGIACAFVLSIATRARPGGA
jgi:predicted exporter